MKLTSNEILAIVNAIGQATADLIEEAGLGEYVQGFAIMVDAERMQALIRDELLAEAGTELTTEVQEYLNSL